MSKRRRSHTCSKDAANGTAPVLKSIEPMTLGNMRARWRYAAERVGAITRRSWTRAFIQTKCPYPPSAREWFARFAEHLVLTSYPIGRVCSGQLVRNECLKGELDEAPLVWSPYVPPYPPTGSSGIKSLGAAILPDGGPHLLWSSGRNEMSTRMPLNKIRLHARTKRPPRYRRAANEAFKRALEAQYGSQGAASPVRRIDPKTGLAVAELSSAENIRQSLGPKLAARL